MGFAIHHPSVTWHVQSLCVLIILIKQSANTSDGRILLHMSIMVWKIDKSTISRLTFSETDFDFITKRLPSGLYTTFRTFAQHTKVIGLSVHLARLYQPAKTQGLVIVRTQRKLRQILAQLLNSMGTDEARLRIVLDTTSEPGTLYVMMQVFQVLPEKLYHEGVCVALSARSREEPKLKKTQFISASATERECIGENVFEILLTHRGRILEGMTSNFFYVCGETLGTAARGVLLGVTREPYLHWRGKRRSGSAIGRCHVTKSLRLPKPLSQAVRAGLFPLPKLSITILAQPERSCRNSWKCMTGNSTLWPNHSCELSRQQVGTDFRRKIME